MAFVAEPVVGATAGAVPATEGYFKRIREICDQYEVLLILDEIMCGVGRSGSFFAFEQEQIEPDLVCIAKGLGAGYQPIGATITNDRIYQAIADGSGFFQVTPLWRTRWHVPLHWPCLLYTSPSPRDCQ